MLSPPAFFPLRHIATKMERMPGGLLFQGNRQIGSFQKWLIWRWIVYHVRKADLIQADFSIRQGRIQRIPDRTGLLVDFLHHNIQSRAIAKSRLTNISVIYK